MQAWGQIRKRSKGTAVLATTNDARQL